MQKTVHILKASGQSVPFIPEKLKASLEASGASPETIATILQKIADTLYEGITTKEIYRTAFSLLKNRSKGFAAKYKLKKAIMELGPSGYPFEQYAAALLRHSGYRTNVGVLVKGHCASHEVDVVAEKEGKKLAVECKFHSNFNRKCDLKVPLYVAARFEDIRKGKKQQDQNYDQSWIVTNTQFTTEALQYGQCSGQVLIAWSYPKKGSLKQRIDMAHLHPITCLTTLKKRDKEALLKKGIVLAGEISANPDVLNGLVHNANMRKRIIAEATALIS